MESSLREKHSESDRKYMPTGTVNKKRSGPSGPLHHYRESHAAFFTIFLSVKTLRNTPRKTLLSSLT